jgi:hypothetical protein
VYGTCVTTAAVPRRKLYLTNKVILSKGNIQVIEIDIWSGGYKANLQQESECDNDNQFFLQFAHC